MTTITIKKAARIPWADHEFRIPTTRIPDPTSKSFLDSRFQIIIERRFCWFRDRWLFIAWEGGGRGGGGGERAEELGLNKAKNSRLILWMLLHWSDSPITFWWLSRFPPRHVFIFQANLTGPPFESFQSFQRSPLLGSQLRLIPTFVLLQSSDPP